MDGDDSGSVRTGCESALDWPAAESGENVAPFRLVPDPLHSAKEGINRRKVWVVELVLELFNIGWNATTIYREPVERILWVF